MTRTRRLPARRFPPSLAAFLAGLVCGLGAAGAAAEVRPPSAVGEIQSQVRREYVVQVGSEPPYFSPRDLTVRVGDTVRWQSDPIAETHGVQELQRVVFGATLAPGASYRYRFLHPGEFEYGCRFHPWMRGHVTVRPFRVAARPLPLAGPALRLVLVSGRVAALMGPTPRLFWPSDGAASGPMEVRLDVVPAAGADGRLWLAAASPGTLVVLDASGAETRREWRPDGHPIAALAAAASGRIWLLEAGSSRLGWLDTTATHVRWSEEPPPSGSARALLVAGDRVFRLTGDGTLWSRAGSGDERERPWPLPPGARIADAAADADSLWCADVGRGKILRVQAERTIEYSLPASLSAPGNLTVAPDRSLWFVAGSRSDRIAHLAADGLLGEYELASEGGPVAALAVDAGAAGWLIRAGGIERLDLDRLPAPEPGRGPGAGHPIETTASGQ